jgi:hypothetical protein
MKTFESKPKVHATQKIFTRKPKAKEKNCKCKLILGSNHGIYAKKKSSNELHFKTISFQHKH